MTCSPSSKSCARIASSPYDEASVYNLKGHPKFDRVITGAMVSACFNRLKAWSCAVPQGNDLFFLCSMCSGAEEKQIIYLWNSTRPSLQPIKTVLLLRILAE